MKVYPVSFSVRIPAKRLCMYTFPDFIVLSLCLLGLSVALADVHSAYLLAEEGEHLVHFVEPQGGLALFKFAHESESYA